MCTGNKVTATYTFTSAIQYAHVFMIPAHISNIFIFRRLWKCVHVCMCTHQAHLCISLWIQTYSFVLFVFCRDPGEISETVYECSLQSHHYLSVISPCWNAQNNQDHCVAIFTDPLTRLGFDESNTQDGLIQPIKVCQITPAQQANKEYVTWCFTPSQPVQLYQGECKQRNNSICAKTNKMQGTFKASSTSTVPAKSRLVISRQLHGINKGTSDAKSTLMKRRPLPSRCFKTTFFFFWNLSPHQL